MMTLEDMELERFTLSGMQLMYGEDTHPLMRARLAQDKPQLTIALEGVMELMQALYEESGATMRLSMTIATAQALFSEWTDFVRKAYMNTGRGHEFQPSQDQFERANEHLAAAMSRMLGIPASKSLQYVEAEKPVNTLH